MADEPRCQIRTHPPSNTFKYPDAHAHGEGMWRVLQVTGRGSCNLARSIAIQPEFSNDHLF